MPALQYPGDFPITQTGDRKARTHKEHLEKVIEQLHTMQAALNAYISGAVDGVLSYGATPGDNFKLQARSSPDMSFEISAGFAVLDDVWYENASTYTSAALTAPVTNPRIDRVELLYTVSSGIVTARAFNIKTGTEAGSPSAPALSSFAIPIGQIYHRVGETSIKDADDSTNGYISSDDRVFVN